jgi:lysophospholipase L1-like esterase
MGRLATAALAVVSVGVALLLVELVLRLAVPAPEGYYIYPPGLRREFEPIESLMPGVSGTSRFVVSSQGLRGDEIPGTAYRALAVGGSTTQCLYLDQSEAWPHRVQQLLEESWQAPVWVGNAGKAGRRLPEYLVQLEHLLPALPGLDLVVMLVGANDVNHRLGAGDPYEPLDTSRPEVREGLLERAFDVYPRTPGFNPLRNSAIVNLLRRAASAIRVRRNWQMVQDARGRNYQHWRDLRSQASSLRDQLPDLGPALAAYRSDLERVLELARGHGVRVLFLSQPSIYREDLGEDEERFLWMGWIGDRQTRAGQEYYSAGAMARAYAAFNRVLLDFCREEGAECIDLAAQVPRDTRSFYDDIHFNEGGSERVAGIVADHLSRERPLSP